MLNKLNRTENINDKESKQTKNVPNSENENMLNCHVIGYQRNVKEKLQRNVTTVISNASDKISETANSFLNSPSTFNLIVPDIWQEIRRKHFEGFTPNEIHLFNLVEPLLNGNYFYKRFSSQYSIKLPAFDPFQSSLHTPEQCGYGLRYFCLSNDLASVTIKSKKTTTTQQSVPVETILKPIIPHNTIEYIRVLKSSQSNTSKNISTDQEDNQIDIGSYYPFSFALAEKGSLELIATNYQILKAWVIGINAISKNKRIFQKFKGIAEAYRFAN